MTATALILSAAMSPVAAPTHLDPLQLFLDAGIVVKLVMFGLLLASIWVWAPCCRSSPRPMKSAAW